MMHHEQHARWPFGGKFRKVDEWLNAGRETLGTIWDLLAEQQVLHPDTLQGIGKFSEYIHAPDVHPLVWMKPDVMNRFKGRFKALIALLAASTSGKDTILKMIRSSHPELIDVVVTHTTKPPRPEDTPGVTYQFVSKSEFQTMREGGQFAEYIQQYGKLYGTSLAALSHSLGNPQTISIWRGEPMGFNELQFKLGWLHPDVPYASVFVLPEVSVSTLVAMILQKRANEWPIERLEKALFEIYAGGSMDICIVNPIQNEGPVLATDAFYRVLKHVQSELATC